MAMLDPAERRKSKRYSVRLKVYEQETGKMLGYADDISIHGIRLMSNEPIQAKNEISVWLDKTEDNPGISLTLYRIWSSISDTEPSYYYAGMYFISPSVESLDAVQELINDLYL